MPAWDALIDEFNAEPQATRGAWLVNRQREALDRISQLRNGSQVVLYGSAFLQKPQIPASSISITNEDLNGLMTVIHGMDWSKGLTLLLHTPGGVTNATESIVDYLRSKFSTIEVVVPTFAMSAGTMISLAADKIVMGRQSQLGPIDPQMNMGGKSVSARAVVEQFERAKAEILADQKAAHVWAPILASLGPSLLQEAQNALDYSEQIVARWLAAYMMQAESDPIAMGKATARHFNDATTHKSHGRRIGRDEARAQGVLVDDLETDQSLQDAVLTSYHVMTIGFEQGPLAKLMVGNTGRIWAKNFMTTEEAAAQAGAQGTQQVPGSRAQPQAAPNRAARRRESRKG